jgi:TIR domain-containing protein
MSPARASRPRSRVEPTPARRVATVPRAFGKVGAIALGAAAFALIFASAPAPAALTSFAQVPTQRTPSPLKQIPPRQPPETPPRESPSCRNVNVSVGCPSPVFDGQTVTFFVDKNKTDIPDNVPRTYAWSFSAGKPISRTDTPSAEVDTTGLSGKTIRVTLVLGVYGLKCADSCVMVVQPPPITAPPTPTLTPTPTQSPTQTPTLTPTLTPTPSPSATPTASPSPSPTPVTLAVATPQPPTPTDTPHPPEDGGTRLPLLPLAVFAALGASALLAAKFFFSHMTGSSSGTLSDTALPTDTGSPSTADEFKHEGAEAVVFGGQKRTDEVHCTAFAPPRVAPGDKFILQVFAHLERQAKQAAEKAAKTDAATIDHGSQPLKEEVERGTLLTFKLEAPGLKVDKAHRRGESLVWRGKPESVQFAVDVPEEHAAPESVRCMVRIYTGEAKAPIGHLIFMLDIVNAATVAAETATAAPASPPQTLKRYKHAFVSYCSTDRLKILPIYLGKRTEWQKAGITDFFDRKDIPAGADWNEEIQKNLDRCDLFVLFWSEAAKGSEGVSREIEYALARKGSDKWNPPTFDPLTIELPVPKPLPEGLESLNFDDALLYLIKAEEALEAEREAPHVRPEDG